MITAGIGFVILGFFLSGNPSPKEIEEPTQVVAHTSPPRIHSSMPGRSQPFMQVKPAEKNETLITSEDEETNKELTEENTPEELPNLSSVDVPSDEEQEAIEETEKESYPVGDFRRLTPQERVRYKQIIKELEDLAREGEDLLKKVTPEDLMRIKTEKELPGAHLIEERN